CMGLPRQDVVAAATNAVAEEAPPLRPDTEWIYAPGYNTNLNGVALISLQSNPGAKGVLLLDFFGGSTPSWGGVNYVVPSAANNLTIRDVWKRVAEDYMPFNINVTTDVKVYQAASPLSRQRCCFTDTPVTAAGVAYEGSWNWDKSTVDTPCWSVYTTGKASAEVAAHEPGHTLGLSHEGQETPNGNGTTTHNEYYAGHGSGATGWAPIMGAGYYQPVTTWSKGEYQYANNPEDQLNIIVTANLNVAYRADDTGSTLATARYLEVYPDSSVYAEGVIGRTAETDAFQFTTTGGDVALFANPVGDWANLAVAVSLADASDTILASNNPTDTIGAGITTNLPAGTYTFRVTGVGRLDPSNTGFSDYSSLGYFSIAGFVTGARQPTRLQVMEHATNGTVVGTIVAADTNSALAYAILSGNTNSTFSVDSNGVVRVANNSKLDYDNLSTNSLFPVQFQMFVNITNLDNPGLTELNRRVIVAVQNETWNQPVDFTGFNAGVIVPYYATTAAPQATGFDVPNNWAFYQAGLNGNPQAGGSGANQGLPQSGQFNSLFDNTVFRFGPYGGNNALLLGAGGHPSSGTLVFATPRAYNTIAVLAASANGGGTGTMIFNFTNGTHQSFSYNAQDWFNTTANVALQGFGRCRLGQATFSTDDNGASNPNFYQTTINLAALGLNQAIASITFNNVSGAGGNQSCGIFAISGVPMPPDLTITTQPQSVTNTVPATAATFTAAAMGVGPLGWQWYFSTNGLPGTYTLLSGKTSATLTLAAVLQTNSVGSYYAVVTNSSGAVTSSVARLTIFRAPVITRQPSPASLTLFVGQSNLFSVAAIGATPITYYWQRNGSTVAAGANANYTLTKAQLASAGDYTVVLSNPYGSVTSSVVSLSVVAAPGSYPYPSAVLADKPLGYWRLDETSGSVAHDYAGGNDGLYHSVIFGQPGCNASDWDPAVQFGPGSAINSYVGGIPVDFGATSNRSFSIEAWVKGGAQTTDAGIVTRGTGSGGEQFNLDTGGNNHGFRFFIRDSFGNAHLASGNITPNGLWHHVVGVCDKDSKTVLLYVDGVTNAVGTIEVAGGILSTTNTMSIGSRQSGTTTFNNQFRGLIDEVAVYNYALTPARVTAHYNAQAVVVSVPVTLQSAWDGTNLILSWPAGKLLQAPAVTGPWTTTSAVSPYTVSPSDTTFYRLQKP
ncbi:MAG TPA: LamG-like jellyroll fold domain-containing protein, partial [Dongiaceae bacterium]|nr:LamG-like jellyroll fold domain-containing protein [Dongiaceae bacterium]